MLTIVLLIKIFLLSHLIVKFEPLHWLLESISHIFTKNIVTKLAYNLFIDASTCIKCTSLWIGILLGGFWIGILASFIAYLYSQLLMPKIDKIRIN